tara:strand:- start:14675 stop:17260 length:2586 start_codon:yes stop_codon:yes gene_type:complete
MKQKFPSRGTILKLIEQSLDEGREKQVIERLQWFLHYSTHGSVSKTCKEFEIARSTFYRWLNRFDINDFSKLTDNSTNSLQLTTNNQKLLLGSRAAFLLALFLINLGVLLFALPTLASAASSWNPTLLVNTEAFQQIDDDDTDSDVYLEFGDTLQEKLLYKRSETRFETTRDLRVAGALTATGSIASSGSITASGNLALNSDNGAINATITFGNDSGAETLTFNDTSNAFDLSDDLNVTGTMSGKRLSFGDHFSGSGTVKWQNITDSTTQFQILDADGGNPVLNVDTTNERVGIGTASPVGNLHIQSSDGSISDVVDANSDDLIIESSGNVAVTVGAGTGNKGRFYFADSEDIDAGEIQFDHATDKFHFRSKGNGFTIDSSGNVGIGTTSPDTDLEVIASSVSDGIIVERSSSDRLKLLGDGTIYWGTTANQGRLSWDTGEAQILALSGNDLSLGSNGVADELYIKSGGKVGIGTTTPTEKLEVIGTISGTILHAQDNLTSSGTLIVDGDAIFQTTTDSTTGFQILDADGGTPILNIDTTNERVGIGTTAPNAILDISDATNDNLRIGTRTGEMAIHSVTDAGAHSVLAFEGSEFNFRTGNVGIGTTSPTANLMIAQSANGTGALIDSEATTAPALAIDAVATPAQVANAPHILFGYRGMFDVKMYRSGTGALRVASESGTTLAVDTESSTATDIAFKIVSDKSSDENTVFKVQADGKTFADGAYSGGGADYAEWFPTQEENLKPGNPVCIDVENDRSVESCTGKLSDIFVGVVSTNPGFIGGHTDELNSGTWVLVGLVGQVMVDVSDETGLIKRGDVLTPADTPGVARKATPWDKNHKGIALIAIENQEEPRDKIKVLLK